MACTDDRAEYALALVERGIRDPDDVRARMESDLGIKLTSGDLNRIMNEAKMEWAGRAMASKTAKPPPKALYVDELVKQIGSRRGVAKFISALEEPDGTNPLFERIVNGETNFTPDEEYRIATAHNLGLAEKAKPTPRQLASNLNDVLAYAADLRRANATRSTAPADPVRAFVKAIADRFGREAAVMMRRNLRAGGHDTILRKAATDPGSLTPEERGKLAVALHDVASEGWRPNAKQLTAAGKEAAETRATARQLALDGIAEHRTHADVATEWGAKHLDNDVKPDFFRAINDLADPNDIHAVGKVIEKYSQKAPLESYIALWRAGLISNPLIVGKVYESQMAHFLASEAASHPAQWLDRVIAGSKIGSGQRTTLALPLDVLHDIVQQGIKAQEGVKEILHGGERELAAAGHEITSKDAEMIPTEFSGNFAGKNAEKVNAALSAYVRAVGRMHAAAYYPAKVMFYQRSLWEQAAIQAADELNKGTITKAQIGERTREIKENATPEMQQRAAQESATGVFLGKNVLSEGIRSAQGRLRAKDMGLKGRVAAAAIDWLAPIRRVPVNIIQSSFDYTFGLPPSVGEVVIRQASQALGKDWGKLSPEAQRALTMRFGRGTVGAVAVTAGLIAKQLFGNNLISPNAKSYDKGGAMAGNFEVAIGNMQPTVTPFEIGASLNDAVHGDKNAMANSIFTMAGDLPGFDTVNNAGEATLSGDSNKLGKFAGEQAATLIPGFVRTLASYTDPSTFGGSGYRQAKTPLDYVTRGIPGAREAALKAVPENPRNTAARVPPSGFSTRGGYRTPAGYSVGR